MSFNNNHKFSSLAAGPTDCRLACKQASKPPPNPMLQRDHPSSSSHSQETMSRPTTKNASVSSSNYHPTKKEGLSLLFAASLLRSIPSNTESLNHPVASYNDITNDDGPLTPQYGDILCGRGGAINQHPGNRIYRRIVGYNKPIYRQVPKRQRQLVSQSIVQIICNNGGRFLQKKNANNNGQWTDIGFRQAVQKTSQALRERDSDSNHNDSSSSPCTTTLENGSTIPEGPSLSGSELDPDDHGRM